MSEQKKDSHGKKPNQKLKAYLVYEYLKHFTDEEMLGGLEEIYYEEVSVPHGIAVAMGSYPAVIFQKRNSVETSLT